MIANNKGFTLIEMLVVIAIIAILSGIVLFSVNLYVYKAKDSNVAGSLAILITAGENYYTGNGNSYKDFCDPTKNSVLRNIITQMPKNSTSACSCSNPDTCNQNDSNTWTGSANPAGVCCYEKVESDGVTADAWVAYAQEFTNTSNFYCVDSRGFQEDTSTSPAGLYQCPS